MSLAATGRSNEQTLRKALAMGAKKGAAVHVDPYARSSDLQFEPEGAEGDDFVGKKIQDVCTVAYMTKVPNETFAQVAQQHMVPIEQLPQLLDLNAQRFGHKQQPLGKSKMKQNT